MTLKPINERFAVLTDDDIETSGGIYVTNAWRTNLDFYVVRGRGEGFAQGDRVVLDDPMCGRRVKIDGAPLRVVGVEHIIGVVE